MKTHNLTTAILKVIKDFDAKSFSAYDITKIIRERVNNKEFYIIDAPTGSFQTIEHSQVNQIIKSLYENNLLNVTAQSNGQYIVYTFCDNSKDKNSEFLEVQQGDWLVLNNEEVVVVAGFPSIDSLELVFIYDGGRVVLKEVGVFRQGDDVYRVDKEKLQEALIEEEALFVETIKLVDEIEKNQVIDLILGEEDE